MESGQPQSLVGESVEVRRFDLAAECADVGEAEVVGDDHEEVRRTRVGDGGSFCNREQRQRRTNFSSRFDTRPIVESPNFPWQIRTDRASGMPVESFGK